MAFSETHSFGAATQVVTYFRSIAARFNATMISALEARSRFATVTYLNGLSDAELADYGLTRDGIVAHVFRDKI